MGTFSRKEVSPRREKSMKAVMKLIRKIIARLIFKITPPIEFEYEFHSVRLSEDMPDFKAVMVIDKFGKCFSEGPILKLECAEMQSWNLTKLKNGSPGLYFQVAGRIFDVNENHVDSVFNYFMNELPHLWKRDGQGNLEEYN